MQDSKEKKHDTSLNAQHKLLEISFSFNWTNVHMTLTLNCNLQM